MNKIPLGIIAAVAKNGAIGKEGGMPWRLKSDLAHFRRLTMGGGVIMGRKTFDSIGKPLDGRANIIVTRNCEFAAAGCIIAHSLADAIDIARNSDADKIFIMGGGEIYAQSILLCDKMHLTEIDSVFEGDAFFPQFNRAEWKETRRESHCENGVKFSFADYDRIIKASD